MRVVNQTGFKWGLFYLFDRLPRPRNSKVTLQISSS